MIQNESLPRQELVRNRCSTKEFLLARTDTPSRKDRKHIGPKEGMDRLIQQFPNALIGKSLLDHAMERLSSCPGFLALGIRIDNFDPAPAESDRQLRTAEQIDQICRKADGVWGPLDADIFGCFLPDTAGMTGPEAAEEIQRGLSEVKAGTASIGIATYPTLDYDRSHILENALKALDHAAFFGPDTVVVFDSVSLNISGDQLYQDGDVEGAAEEFRLALKLDPENVNVYNSLGVCYGVMENFEKALDAFERAISLNGDEIMPIYNAGLVHSFQGDTDRALAYFCRADEKEDIFEVALHAGRLLLDGEMPTRARPYLEKAVRLNPAFGPAHRSLGECCEKAGDPGAALEAYKQAVKKNPNDAAALSAMGILYDHLGKSSEIATLFCRQSVEICPDIGLYRRRLGEILYRQDQPEAALEQFREASARGEDCRSLIERIESELKN